MSWLMNMLSEVFEAFSGDGEPVERNDRNGRNARRKGQLAPVRLTDRDPRRDPRRERDHDDRFDHFW